MRSPRFRTEEAEAAGDEFTGESFPLLEVRSTRSTIRTTPRPGSSTTDPYLFLEDQQVDEDEESDDLDLPSISLVTHRSKPHSRSIGSPFPAWFTYFERYATSAVQRASQRQIVIEEEQERGSDEMAFFDNLRHWDRFKAYRYMILLALSLAGDGW